MKVARSATPTGGKGSLPACPADALIHAGVFPGIHVATRRKAIGKKDRFEVFKRDGFKCQYCGQSAPDVVLQVDHIRPVAGGGTNDILNLVTSCFDCNSGKGARALDDRSAVQRQRAQIQELNDRREQLEMMLAWRDGMKAIEEEQSEAIVSIWKKSAPGWTFSDEGKKKLCGLIRKHGFQSVLAAMDEATQSYIVVSEDGAVSKESADLAMSKFMVIAGMSSMPPDRRRLYYVRGILRRRMNNVWADVVDHMACALDRGVSVDEIERQAKTLPNWPMFRDWLLCAELAH